MKNQDKTKSKGAQKISPQTFPLFHAGKEEQHIGHLKTQEVLIETSNPYFQPTHPESSSNPRTVKAIANAQSRPIVLLYTKGHISKVQYKAAERFYIYWRQNQADLHMSPDYTRQKVACSQRYTHPIERQLEASNHLKKIKVLLGVLGYSLVEQVVGYGQTIKDLNPSKRKQNSLADHLRDCLELLAFHWGYASLKHSK
ncbi:hypothetical protein [Bartonella quintana]|uniref:Uncharacterized protein n=3 Tax=Bartonella quintana TaxID=803 RepID=A0A0H3M3V4_BARQU|nr:hypothetical protein [Bartonella quintana]ETS12503.1 hypothetical protein Q651_00852 [Bartonella quintana BQ2-D70]ETS14673.1 hypothetical protein Q650_00059 [Bartonella quintana JK 73rel]ETS17106.1 hypothetical protein Q649_00060 [Bartonella quintana JK 73]ETS17309.1 hypothetical protein Q648_00916 [Bartonella quintana JK 12]ETS19399.1 hypothetical protein Q647_00059 [Bartonella quintana JK 7]